MITKRDVERKVIHSSLIVVLLLHYFLGHNLTLIVLTASLTVYSVSEIIRLKRINFPVTKIFVDCCASEKEKKSFMISPFLLAFSIIAVLYFFEGAALYISVISATLGDSFAALVGKAVGRTKLPYNKRKTVEGSLACFAIVSIVSLFFVDWKSALLVGIAVFFAESVTNENWDNILIPFISAIVASLV